MKVFKFYGAESNRFRLDDTFWEAIEDSIEFIQIGYLGGNKNW